MRVLSKKKKYADGGRMYSNGGGVTGPQPDQSAMDMFNALSPALKEYATNHAMNEFHAPTKRTMYGNMRRNNQFDAMRDRDGNIVPRMSGDSIYNTVSPYFDQSDQTQGEASFGMLFNRMLDMAYAGDEYANNILNRIQENYEGRQNEMRMEAERQARLSKGSGKPGPYQR